MKHVTAKARYYGRRLINMNIRYATFRGKILAQRNVWLLYAYDYNKGKAENGMALLFYMVHIYDIPGLSICSNRN